MIVFSFFLLLFSFTTFQLGETAFIIILKLLVRYFTKTNKNYQKIVCNMRLGNFFVTTCSRFHKVNEDFQTILQNRYYWSIDVFYSL